MTRPVRVDDAARDEIAAAVSWYDAQTGELNLGTELLDVVDVALGHVGERPASFPLAHGVPDRVGARQCPIGRFPFRLIFIELTSVVQVIAFAHARRRPGYWRNRL